MDFMKTVRTCLDFSVANGATIQSYPAGYRDRLDIQSRTSRTEIGVERVGELGLWHVRKLRNFMGEKSELAPITVETEEQLRAQLADFWKEDVEWKKANGLF